MKFIVVTGNIVDGFTHYGPFDTAEDARVFAEDNLRGLDWTATLLYTEVQ
jgi:hypothetical protein